MAYFAPAHQLYTRFGFQLCGPFDRYKDDPNSVFMTREISETALPEARGHNTTSEPNAPTAHFLS